MINYGKFAYYNTKYGIIKIGYIKNLITLIKFTTQDEYCDKNRNEISDKAYKQIREYFEGKRKIFDLPLLLMGTEFQKKVWNALSKIPYGETRSYKQIAIEIGNNKASRAIGMANNKNPIIIVIPCHRVIGVNGKLVGYGGGLDRKEAFLKLESKNK